MKNIQIRYADTFEPGPMTWWVGPRYGYWVQEKTASGQSRRPQFTRSPVYDTHKRHAQLIAHVDGITMVFASPMELDHFIDVMSRNPLPSGANLMPGWPGPGLPNRHWLSRFPAKGKSHKYRMKAVKFLSGPLPAIREFRAFYATKSFDETDVVFNGAPHTGSGQAYDPYRKSA